MKLPQWFLFVLFVPTYALTTWLGYMFYLTPDSVSALWAGSGVLLGFLLLTNSRLWPVILIVAGIISVIVGRTMGDGDAITFADLSAESEALLGALLIRYVAKSDLTLVSIRSWQILVGFGAILAPAIVSLWGTYNFVSVQPEVPYWSAWQVWWLADLLGIIVATPFVTSWLNGKWPVYRWQEGVVTILLLAVVIVFVMGGEAKPVSSILDYPYVITPMLAWIALRMDTRIVTSATVLLAFSVVWMTDAGMGPFVLTAADSVQANVLAVQAFLITMIAGMGFLHTAMFENRLANKEKLQLLEAARRNQKLEVLGRLAAGVAHNFGNDLFAIRSNAKALKSASSDNVVVADNIERAAARSAERVRELLDFGGPQEGGLTLLDVDTHLTEMSDAIHTAASSKVLVEFDCTAGKTIRINQARFEQSVLNLVINARDALGGNGRVRINTRSVRRDSFLDVEYDPSRMLQISVEDNGPGMSEDVIEHAFEPFFTTKAEDKGTGMGLASVYGFVHSSGGEIEIESSPGHGTKVKILFPIES